MASNGNKKHGTVKKSAAQMRYTAERRWEANAKRRAERERKRKLDDSRKRARVTVLRAKGAIARLDRRIKELSENSPMRAKLLQSKIKAAARMVVTNVP